MSIVDRFTHVYIVLQTASVKLSATGLGSLGLPPIELHADCRPLHTGVHCFATGLGSLGFPPNELHVVCKTMYTTAAAEAHMSLRRGCSLPVPCHDGSTVLAVVFESLVVLSAVSGSVGGVWGVGDFHNWRRQPGHVERLGHTRSGTILAYMADWWLLRV